LNEIVLLLSKKETLALAVVELSTFYEFYCWNFPSTTLTTVAFVIILANDVVRGIFASLSIPSNTHKNSVKIKKCKSF